MEGQAQEFGIELRGGQVSATEWQLVETTDSREAAQEALKEFLKTHREARIVTRYVTPWCVDEEEGK